MNLSKINIREKEFHNKLHLSGKPRPENKFYKAIKKFDLIANDKNYQWRHILKPGELLIFNNWRILHGRASFSGTRKISGCYINKEDFDSSCKTNGII